jgi:CRP/FNR family transcriptional regulator
MRAPYGITMRDDCKTCTHPRPASSFCQLSHGPLEELHAIGHTTLFPSGAILFLEGQPPRGVFIVCSGKVKLSTTSRGGRVLLLRMAEAGDVLGLSAVVSGSPCVLSAETAQPCQLKFVEKEAMVRFMHRHGEASLRCAQALSYEFQSACDDIHDLVMPRSSAGKLARLLLSWSPPPGEEKQVRITPVLTHEEMAQMIGSSRETVTRLMSDLRRKRLIRDDGEALVIRDRTKLEAIAA